MLDDQMNLFGSGGEPPSSSRPSPGSARAPRKHHQLFFAIRPDAQAAQEIAKLGARLDQQYGIGGQPLKPDHLHVTLHAIGAYDEIPDAVLLAARQAAEAVRADAFDVVFDRAMTFAGSRPYVLCGGEGVEPVKALWLTLGMELANVFPFKKTSYTPHMTLSYKGRHMAEHPIEPIRWTAREFVLIDSHLGKNLHDPVGRWPLRV